MEKPYRQNAAVIITDGQGRVLLCTRIGIDAFVQTVQGGIDPGETAREAAARELGEEVGLRPDQFTIVAECPGTFAYDFTPEMTLSPSFAAFRGQEQKFFLARVAPDTTFVLDGHHEQEFSRVWWDTPQELVRRAWEGKRPGIQKALEVFGLLP